MNKLEKLLVKTNMKMAWVSQQVENVGWEKNNYSFRLARVFWKNVIASEIQCSTGEQGKNSLIYSDNKKIRLSFGEYQILYSKPVFDGS